MRPALIVALCLLLHAVPARADTFEWAYDQGLSALKKEAYADAVTYFQRAYALRPQPGLLLLIGRTHLKMGHASQAIVYLKLYLDLDRRLDPFVAEEVKQDMARAQRIVDRSNNLDSPSQTVPAVAKLSPPRPETTPAPPPAELPGLPPPPPADEGTPPSPAFVDPFAESGTPNPRSLPRRISSPPGVRLLIAGSVLLSVGATIVQGGSIGIAQPVPERCSYTWPYRCSQDLDQVFASVGVMSAGGVIGGVGLVLTIVGGVQYRAAHRPARLAAAR